MTVDWSTLSKCTKKDAAARCMKMFTVQSLPWWLTVKFLCTPFQDLVNDIDEKIFSFLQGFGLVSLKLSRFEAVHCQGFNQGLNSKYAIKMLATFAFSFISCLDLRNKPCASINFSYDDLGASLTHPFPAFYCMIKTQCAIHLPTLVKFTRFSACVLSTIRLLEQTLFLH